MFDYRHLFAGLLGAVLGSFFTHAFHLKAGTAVKADKLLGGQVGAAQNVLDAAERAIVTGAVSAVEGR